MHKQLIRLMVQHCNSWITPLNYARYQFIYPEDIQTFGMSFNTNVGSTTVQGDELHIRPDFPLATNAGDQINQIVDASLQF